MMIEKPRNTDNVIKCLLFSGWLAISWVNIAPVLAEVTARLIGDALCIFFPSNTIIYHFATLMMKINVYENRIRLVISSSFFIFTLHADDFNIGKVC